MVMMHSAGKTPAGVDRVAIRTKMADLAEAADPLWSHAPPDGIDPAVRSRDWHQVAFLLYLVAQRKLVSRSTSVGEGCMHDWRYATPDALLRPSSNAPEGARNSRLRHWLAGCAPMFVCSCQRQGILDPQGPIASAQQFLLINATEIMLVVIVPVILATLGFAWWYRSSNTRAKRSEELAYEGRIDFVVWSIPALVVILLGGVNWIGSHELDPRAPISANAKPLQVHVVSLDWKWLFIYPDQGIAAVNQLVIPAGTPI